MEGRKRERRLDEYRLKSQGKDGACDEKYKRQIRFTDIFELGEHNSCFHNLLLPQKAEITNSSYREENSN